MKSRFLRSIKVWHLLSYLFFLLFRLSERQYNQLKYFQKGTEFGSFQVWAEKSFNALICRDWVGAD